jgi:hypothetical protein
MFSKKPVLGTARLHTQPSAVPALPLGGVIDRPARQPRSPLLAGPIGATLNLTAVPAGIGNLLEREPEFVRVGDLRFLTGLKRGLAYRKIADGTFKSITLREPGNKFGVRLVYWPSVKAWLHSLLKEQNPHDE